MKAYSPILFTLPGIFTVVRPGAQRMTMVLFLFRIKLFSLANSVLFGSTVKVVKLVQSLKADSRINLTLSGILTDASLVQP